jgi:hypothetical protein
MPQIAIGVLQQEGAQLSRQWGTVAQPQYRGLRPDWRFAVRLAPQKTDLRSTGLMYWKMCPLGLDQSVFRGAWQKPKKDFSLDQKNGPLFRGPFFNIWSGKRDSHLAPYPLKSIGFLISPKREWTYFWTCSQGMSRTGKNIIPSRATECSLQLVGEATSMLRVESYQSGWIN